MFDFSCIVGFDWDRGNKQKNGDKHQVDFKECEEVFFNRPLITGKDRTHSNYETRNYALGRTDTSRPLFLAFTIKNNKIRVISAREQTSKERKNMDDKNEPVPRFNNEDEERSFWATHDSTEYIDWDKSEKNPVFPRLKPSTRPVSIRLPESLIAELKMLANKMDVPYQSLMKTILAEKVREELAPYNHTRSE